MIYTVDNTAKAGKPVVVTVNGSLIPLCVRALAFGPFVVAEAFRTNADGMPVLLGNNVATQWFFGIGRVELVELAA